MALVSLKEILWDARKKKYAVGMFDVFDEFMGRTMIRAAEDEGAPIILASAEVLDGLNDKGYLGHWLREQAEKAKVPICVHYDHGVTFEAIMKAIGAGFNSVMYDGSRLSYEDNLNATKDIVRIAHAAGCDVEVELGHVGGGGDEADPNGEENVMTDPAMAEEFVKKSGSDALAVSIGTAHGVYAAKPKLDFELLKSINAITTVPLVLHGGSGLTVDDFKTCVENGISKINIFTETLQVMTHTMAKELFTDGKFNGLRYTELYPKLEENLYALTVDKIRVFGSNGRA